LNPESLPCPREAAANRAHRDTKLHRRRLVALALKLAENHDEAEGFRQSIDLLMNHTCKLLAVEVAFLLGLNHV
jgi:hypothetical protein